MQLLEYLQDIVESAPKVPITGKVLVDKKELTEVLDQIFNYLPDDIKKAQWIVSEKERIMAEAKKEYETIKNDTMDMIKKQVENHDITKEAQIKGQEIISAAQRDAKAIRLGARDYADEILCQLEKELELKTNEIINSIKVNVENLAVQLTEDISSSSSDIRENIKELRSIK
ncbi:ATPase [Clostridium polynesiense]|uniref:ATPase n=1 Tax=Clostridium polynesiense TaxID=1325933 RepID=UPI001FA7D6B5|nr:ATPase [Clostridium polynesiense]